MFDKVQAEFWRVLINIFIIRVLSLLRPGGAGVHTALWASFGVDLDKNPEGYI